jgi:endonuclease/exonuclease/phosphatase family metal-dependent hydrolase
MRAAGYLCTTHLDSERPVDAYAQCRYLMSEAIPAMLAQHGEAAVVVAGDLNLRTGHAPDPRSCVPASYAHVDDGARQHLMASGRYRVASADTVDMQGTTDHPGLLVDLTIR